MKIGYYKKGLKDFYGEGLSVIDAAILFADEHHQIYNACDLNFTLYVQDDKGVMHTVKLTAEFDPVYSGVVVE